MSELPAVVEQPDGSLGIVEMSGEIVAIRNASDEALGRWFTTYKHAQDLLRSAKRDIDAEFIRRADFNATQHLDIQGYGRVTVDGPKDEEVWRVEDLRACLKRLVSEGSISETAAYAALEKVVSWKVKASGINNLRKLGGYVQGSIDACCDRVPPVRRARLTEHRTVVPPVETPGG